MSVDIELLRPKTVEDPSRDASTPCLTGNTRQVFVTHDGKPIGHTEPLTREWRGNAAVSKTKKVSRSRLNGLLAAMRAKKFSAKGAIRAAQTRSLTMRGK
jgi:hypothetical protein